MGRRTLLLITSILIAAVGTALIGLYVKGANSRATDKQSLVGVLVATTTINPGERATQSNSKIEPWVKADLPPSPLYSAASIANQTAVSTIYPRTVLQPGMFSTKATTGTADNGIPTGLLGVNIELGDPERVAGLLKVGSRVVIFSRPKGKPSRAILGQDDGGIQIIELGNNYLSPTINGTSNLSTRTSTGTQNVASTLIGVALSQSDVIKLKDASVNGDLYFGVVSSSTPKASP